MKNKLENTIIRLAGQQYMNSHRGGGYGKDVKMTTTLGDLSFDSLDYVEFAMALEKEFNIDITEKDIMLFKKDTDLEDVAEIVKKYF